MELKRILRLWRGVIPSACLLTSVVLCSILAYRQPQRLAYDLQKEYCAYQVENNSSKSLGACLLEWCSLGSFWALQTCYRVDGSSSLGPDYFKSKAYDPLYNHRNLDEKSLKDKDNMMLAFCAVGLLLLGGLVDCGFWARVAARTCNAPASETFHLCWLAVLWVPTVVLVLVFALKTSETWGMYNLPQNSWTAAAAVSTLPFFSAAHYVSWNSNPLDTV